MSQSPALSWPHGTTQFEQRFGNALTRVVVAVIGIPIILGAVWYGGWAFFLLMAAAGMGALLEFYWITEKRGARPNKGLGVAAGLLLCLAFMHGVSDRMIVELLTGEAEGASGVLYAQARFMMTFGTLALFTIAALIRQMYRVDGSAVIDTMATLAGVTYISMFMAMLIGIRQLFVEGLPFHDYLVRSGGNLLPEVGDYGAYTVLAILVAIWVCDSAAYYAGRAFGRHKLFERVSPKKTWEGSVAGALAAMGTMIGMQQWLLTYLTVIDAVALGLVVGVFGQLGDLAESHLKRDAGVKDSSYLIPGHGGVFDRFDSLLFVAPFVYVYLNVVVLAR